jgi:hypothetical protein
VIHPLITSVPSVVRQRSRNGLSGMGFTVKNPISSTVAVVIAPALVWISSVPVSGGMICPRRPSSVTSSSIDSVFEVKVRARIDAVSDLVAAARCSSLWES